MTVRENVLAVLNYEPFDAMPVVGYNYWNETIRKWEAEGHISHELVEDYFVDRFGSDSDQIILEKLGFDCTWMQFVKNQVMLFPPFEKEVLQELPDGHQIIRDENGMIYNVKPGVEGIPSHLGSALTDRKAWEEIYLPRFQMDVGRVPVEKIKALPKPEDREKPVCLHLGSLMGNMRNMLGFEDWVYLYAEDEDLYREIANTMCSICYECAKVALETGVQFDYAHFWEDISCKSGPMINPDVLRDIAGPWYRKITDLCYSHGISIISLDCDGIIDQLIPVWLDNGVNTLVPIEVGTWGASIKPWKEKYGKAIRGVGGMNKNLFATDRETIDKEVERLTELARLGGYIPCPDHLIPPDGKWELVQYYCDKMHQMKL